MYETGMLVDVSTTQNTLMNSFECPIQCDIETFSLDTILNPSSKTSFNIIPDEKPMPAACIQTGFSLSQIYNNENGYNGVPAETAIKTIYTTLSAAVQSDKYVIGYNLKYDLRIINQNAIRILKVDPINFKSEYLIDILDFAKRVIPIEDICSYTAENVFIALTGRIDLLDKIHAKGKGSAIDNGISRIILSYLSKKCGFTTFKEITEYLNSPELISTFTFGKYKGMKIKDVLEKDRQYVDWVLSCNEIMEKNQNLKFTLKQFLSDTSK